MSQQADRWEDAFESLCQYFLDEDIEFIDKTLLQKNVAQGIYWLVRYLVRIERPNGFEKLLNLAQSPQLAIRQEACAGITRISREAQPTLLIKLLQSRDKTLVTFAATQMGRLRSWKGTMALIDALEENDAEDVQIALLKSLAVLQDPRAFKALQRWASHSKGKIQEEALTGLVRFTATLNPRVIRHCLSSENSRVKEMVYRAIVRRHGFHWENIVACGLREDAGGELTAKILPAIREVRSPELARVLLDLAQRVPSMQIRALAASAIRRVRSDSIRRMLLKEERHRRGQEKIPLLQFLAEYGDDDAVYRCLRRFAQQGDPSVRLSALEGLARFKGRCRETVPFLRRIIQEDDRFSFAAASTLAELMTPPLWKEIVAVLSLDEQRRSLAIQLVLKYLTRLLPTVETPPEVAQRIVRLLPSNQPTLRSLAVRCFARLKQESVVEKLVGIAAADPETSVRHAAFHSVVSLMRERPNRLMRVIQEVKGSHSLWRMLSRLFREVTPPPQEVKTLLKELLQRAVDSSSNRTRWAQARWLLLVRTQVEQQKSIALEALREEIFSEPERQQLLHVLNTMDPEELGTGQLDFMALQYERASSETKLEYLRFFQRRSWRSPSIERVVFNAMSKESDPAVRSGVSAVISMWVAQA